MKKNQHTHTKTKNDNNLNIKEMNKNEKMEKIKSWKIENKPKKWQLKTQNYKRKNKTENPKLKTKKSNTKYEFQQTVKKQHKTFKSMFFYFWIGTKKSRNAEKYRIPLSREYDFLSFRTLLGRFQK